MSDQLEQREQDRDFYATLASDAGSEPAHKPGDHHDYHIECAVCGQRGTLNLSVEPQRYEADAERQGEL